jgi:hypothetical protein
MSRQLIIGILVLLFSSPALVLVEIILTQVPQWVLRVVAWLCFVAGLGVICLTDNVYPSLESHPKSAMPLLLSLVALAGYVFLYLGFPFKQLKAEEPTKGRSGQENQRAMVKKFRRMIIECERKYKRGKEPGVSFAEIIQRQPDYLELEPYLSQPAMDALTNDRLGKNPVVTGKVDGKDFVNPPDALRSIFIRELTRIEQSPDLGSALRPESEIALIGRPQLDITFDKRVGGYVDNYRGQSFDGKEIVDWRLYRVGVSSDSTRLGTRLRAVDLTLKGGRNYPSLLLRIMGDPEATEFKLHAGDPQLWDVVEKPIGSDWLRLTHIVKTAGIILLQAPCQFRITASCDDGFSISKLVSLDVDKDNNNELNFRLDDTT